MTRHHGMTPHRTLHSPTTHQQPHNAPAAPQRTSSPTTHQQPHNAPAATPRRSHPSIPQRHQPWPTALAMAVLVAVRARRNRCHRCPTRLPSRHAALPRAYVGLRAARSPRRRAHLAHHGHRAGIALIIHIIATSSRPPSRHRSHHSYRCYIFIATEQASLSSVIPLLHHHGQHGIALISHIFATSSRPPSRYRSQVTMRVSCSIEHRFRPRRSRTFSDWGRCHPSSTATPFQIGRLSSSRRARRRTCLCYWAPTRTTRRSLLSTTQRTPT